MMMRVVPSVLILSLSAILGAFEVVYHTASPRTMLAGLLGALEPRGV